MKLPSHITFKPRPNPDGYPGTTTPALIIGMPGMHGARYWGWTDNSQGGVVDPCLETGRPNGWLLRIGNWEFGDTRALQPTADGFRLIFRNPDGSLKSEVILIEEATMARNLGLNWKKLQRWHRKNVQTAVLEPTC